MGGFSHYWGMLISSRSAPPVPERYMHRRANISRQATGIGSEPARIEYLSEEHQTWTAVMARLRPLWDRHVAADLQRASESLDLPMTRIPQLQDVSERLRPLTGFTYAAVPGTVSGVEFFGALGDKIFPSTQFIRWSGDPSYTPQPDVIHELGGHATSLAHPLLAELHHLAGQAAAAAPEQLSSIAAVFWYTIEFGVIIDGDGPKAYGTGLLSSPGELAWFSRNAEVRPIELGAMLALPYDIDHYQPVLFGAKSLEHAAEIAGSYFASHLADSPTTRGTSRTSAP